ncbi:hypothetical protein KC957_01260 [Candidatus Saccharibacteria bacterium]|nr:hypothetical protein [Candidatus Saccharibacteria bacterium]
MQLRFSHEPCGDQEITVDSTVEVLVIDCDPPTFCISALCECGARVDKQLPPAGVNIAQSAIDGGAKRIDIAARHEPTVVDPLPDSPLEHAIIAHQLARVEHIGDLEQPRPIALTPY